jgi:VWFA-related protein
MRRGLAALALASAILVWPLTPDRRPAAQSATATSPSQAAPAQAAPEPAPQQPTFKAGVNFVRVDVIVTDRRGEVADLRQEDFELMEDGKPQKIESFKLIDVTTGVAPGGAQPRAIRDSADEEAEAARDDVRLFAVFLDDYHVRRENSMRVRETLAAFVENQLQPLDMIGLMYPLTPVADVLLTRDRDAVARALRQFDGRKYNYTPRNQAEEQYVHYPTGVAEQIRNEVTMSALEGLVIHLGGLREGRKAVILVSEGFSATLPPEAQDQDATIPGMGLPGQPVSSNSSLQTSSDFFARSALQQDLREITTLANRYNTTIYALDPRGLAASEFGLDRNVRGVTDRASLEATLDTLHQLADETDGRAIVNSNDLDRGLRQVVRDSSAYYLLGYSSQAPADGKFHDIKVRVKRSGVDVRARRGFWGFTAADMARATAPAKTAPLSPVQTALTALDNTSRAQAIRTWIGMAPGDSGKTKVTFVWEPMPTRPGDLAEVATRVRLVATGPDGQPYFRGEASSRGSQEAGGSGAGDSLAGRPSRAVFQAPPGQIDIALTVEDGGAQVIDRDVRGLAVDDFSGAGVKLSTPEVFRSRTAREWQAISVDPEAVPEPGRVFRRTERLLIRVGAYGSGEAAPPITARLLNRAGQPMLTLTVTPAGVPGRVQQIDLPLAGLAAGDYVIEIRAGDGSGGASELIPLRVAG